MQVDEECSVASSSSSSSNSIGNINGNPFSRARLGSPPARRPPPSPMGDGRKRHHADLCDEEGDGQGSAQVVHTRPRSFIPVRKAAGIYESDCIFPYSHDSYTLYSSMQEDTLINVANFDKITFGEGRFILADDHGNWGKEERGSWINFWKFDASARKMFVVHSVAFSKLAAGDFVQLRAFLSA